MTSQNTEALKALVEACEKEFCSPATEGGELVSADDESVMGPGECAITFGKIRAARAALERMLASQMGEPVAWMMPNGQPYLNRSGATGEIPLYAAPAAGMDADSAAPAKGLDA